MPNIYLATTAATMFTLAIIFVSATITPVSASITGIDTTTTPSSGLELSAQPVWDEQVTSTGVTPINETHSIGTFIGNGTMTVPDTGETVNMTNNGTAIISPVPGYANTVSASGREYVFSEDDDDISAITFHEIIRYDPVTFEGKGVVIAVFDNNATGSLAPFNGMMVVGTHEEDPSTRTATIRLWEWQGGIPILTGGTTTTATTTPEELHPQMDDTTTTTTTTTNATTTDAAADTNATTAGPPEEEVGGGGEQQQQQTTPTIPPAPNPLFE